MTAASTWRCSAPLADLIAAKTIECGDCLLWTGPCSGGNGKKGGNKHPAVKIDGKWQLLRRVLYVKEKGPIPEGKVLRVTCHNTRCLNPEHWKLTTFQKLGVECAQAGLMSDHLRSAKIAATKRAGAQTRITQEAVREIRASNDTGKVLAQRYGVCESHISKIRLNKVRREFSSPWAGLGAMS